MTESALLVQSDADADHASLQYLFDTSARHLLKQGRPGVDADCNCRYHTAEGFGCAAAPFIKDPRPSDRGAWDTFVYEHPERVVHQAKGQTDFIMRLQQAHDVAARFKLGGWAKPATPEQFMPVWRNEMAEIARGTGLSMAVFNESPFINSDSQQVAA